MLDSSTLTFRTFINRQHSSASPMSQNVPSYQELSALQQELQLLSDKASLQRERYESELSRLEASSFSSSKTGGLPEKAGKTTLPPGVGGGSSAGASGPNTVGGSSSTSSSSNSTATTTTTTTNCNSSSLPKPGLVTLKLKRSDATENGKTDDEQSSTPTTIKLSAASFNALDKKKRKKDNPEDSDYSEDDRGSLAKAKREEFKQGRSASPQPTKFNPKNSTPKAQASGSHQKKKRHSETEKHKPKMQEVQDDFSKVKVATQIPIQTFWASMDPYFRPFSESDRMALEEEHYLDAWAEEERSLMPSFDGFDSRRNSIESSSTKDAAPSRNIVSNTPFELTDENIEQDEVSCGPLTERILSSLVAENVIDSSEIKQDDETATTTTTTTAGTATATATGSQPPRGSSNPCNYAELEERMKRELRYIGLLGDDEIDWDAREDDEISITLRSLQKELREVMQVNQYRKQKLAKMVSDHLAYQEYNMILDDLDKQVEQGYLKRFRITKSKKKKTTTPKSLSENALSAMDRRRRFIQGVGPIFPAEKFSIPRDSIYDDEPVVQPGIHMDGVGNGTPAASTSASSATTAAAAAATTAGTTLPAAANGTGSSSQTLAGSSSQL
ncbi:Transcriptional regulator [Actinomortierella ambigua]|uniref:Transcriptional regulator n=1 Tax=Actinomortierella ambigua TaxID=1343610 RepID=A0A9P6U294_9FUNG|nr:Transcriptional regulator [Actinomortierella ambigua]